MCRHPRELCGRHRPALRLLGHRRWRLRRDPAGVDAARARRQQPGLHRAAPAWPEGRRGRWPSFTDNPSRGGRLLVFGLVRGVGTVGQELTGHLLADLDGRDVVHNGLGTDWRSGKQAG
jgi:hypothetical protein